MKKVGLLVPKTNLTVEYELQYLYNNHFFNIEDIAFYISKLDFCFFHGIHPLNIQLPYA